MFPDPPGHRIRACHSSRQKSDSNKCTQQVIAFTQLAITCTQKAIARSQGHLRIPTWQLEMSICQFYVNFSHHVDFSEHANFDLSQHADLDFSHHADLDFSQHTDFSQHADFYFSEHADFELSEQGDLDLTQHINFFPFSTCRL